jgi:hypothetical protein
METTYLRRPQAGAYVREKYGFCSPRVLALRATTGGGPKYRRIGRIVVYSIPDLDEWAEAQISGPVASTSEYATNGGRPAKAVKRGAAS